MSVSLDQVISSAGFDLETREDALWLISKSAEFDELLLKAEDLIEKLDDEQNELEIKELEEALDD